MFDDLGEVDAKLQVSAYLIYLMLNDRRPKSQKSWTPWRERDADLKVRKLVARYIETHQPRACVQPCHLIVYHIIEAVVPFWDACSTQRFFQNSSLLGDQFTVTFSFTLRSSNPSKLKSSNKDKHTPHFFLTSFRDVCSTYKFFQKRSIAAKSVYSIILIYNVLF